MFLFERGPLLIRRCLRQLTTRQYVRTSDELTKAASEMKGWMVSTCRPSQNLTDDRRTSLTSHYVTSLDNTPSTHVLLYCKPFPPLCLLPCRNSRGEPRRSIRGGAASLATAQKSFRSRWDHLHSSDVEIYCVPWPHYRTCSYFLEMREPTLHRNSILAGCAVSVAINRSKLLDYRLLFGGTRTRRRDSIENYQLDHPTSRRTCRREAEGLAALERDLNSFGNTTSKVVRQSRRTGHRVETPTGINGEAPPLGMSCSPLSPPTMPTAETTKRFIVHPNERSFR